MRYHHARRVTGLTYRQVKARFAFWDTAFNVALVASGIAAAAAVLVLGYVGTYAAAVLQGGKPNALDHAALVASGYALPVLASVILAGVALATLAHFRRACY